MSLRLAAITETIQDIHERVVERRAPGPGERWLDLACGTGAVAERAAAAGATVTGLDLAPALIETAKERAAELALDIRYVIGDVEQLEFEEASFDRVSSTCGIMFSPDHAAAARARVTRPGGRIALANWDAHRRPGEDVQGDGALHGGAAGEQPVRLGRREPSPRAPGRVVRAHARTARLHAAGPFRGGLVGAVLDLLRPDEDARRLARRRREQLRRDWVDFFENNYRTNGEIVHAREYVLVLGTRV